MAKIDQEAADLVLRIAADAGRTPREVWDNAAQSSILLRQLLDPKFAALADEPAADREAFKRGIDEILDDEQAQQQRRKGN